MMTLDRRMTFAKHIKYVCDKAKKVIKALNAILPNVGGPQASRRRVLAMRVQSVVLYGAPVWEEALGYLNNRRITLSREDEREVFGGVPQGSVLGPTLWNVLYDSVMELPVPEGTELCIQGSIMSSSGDESDRSRSPLSPRERPRHDSRDRDYDRAALLQANLASQERMTAHFQECLERQAAQAAEREAQQLAKAAEREAQQQALAERRGSPPSGNNSSTHGGN
ncbi:uncharacterized protein LOC126749262 [Anthonomus grandis grandis]|uniref:uncharacterized protein LOC126749262 n=1 Tax=Anthonomus grandis grandis TaxID=2921223 RepID=UPI00216508CC|nr:uncharacterized protein LOC126749262 [Anthonomus grandis grandis]